jgi:hypothetical protein
MSVPRGITPLSGVNGICSPSLSQVRSPMVSALSISFTPRQAHLLDHVDARSAVGQ